MFGHDKHDEDQDDVVHPVSTKPLNEDLLGVNNDDGSDSSDDQPSSDDNSEPVEENDSTSPAADADDKITDPEPAKDIKDSTDNNELLDIKRQALQELSPLIDNLEQTPEEKYKTTMMMIQAADDKSLIPTAYSAAKKISDDTARAQALLDIINEINYFTQPK